LTVFKNTQISYVMKICPVGAELFLVDRWTERHDKCSCCFLQFCRHAL